MKYEVVFLLGADLDFLEIYSNCGDRFYDRIEGALKLLAGNPWLGPNRPGGFRRLLLSDTPFGIFYNVHGERIFICAILDLRQDPEQIARKLRERR